MKPDSCSRTAFTPWMARRTPARTLTTSASCLFTTGLFLLAACGAEPTAPVSEEGLEPVAQFAKGGNPDLTPQCATDPDWIVTNQQELRQAMIWDAQEGDVIAIEGLIVTNRGSTTWTGGLTITCASPGSGLVADPALPWDPNQTGYLLRIYSPNVTVSGLVLDAAAAPGGPLYAVNNGAGRRAENLVFTNNAVTCGSGSCLTSIGASGALVADNDFRADGTSTGVHLQGYGDYDPQGDRQYPTDGTRVLRNTVVITAPSSWDEYWWMVMAGIRVRDGESVTVAHNRVEGPWIHTLSFANLRGSAIAQNSGSGAQFQGINLWDAASETWTFDNAFRNNQISEAGEYGLFATESCRNTFLGNNFQRPGLGAAAFAETTGANAFVGNGKTVIDNGDWDCDGDGIADPNLITGSGRILSGVKLGMVVRNGAKAPTGTQVH